MNVFAAATTRHRHRRAAQATTAPVMMMAASSTVPVTHMSSAMSVIGIAASSAPRAPWPAAAARVLYTLQGLGQQRVQHAAQHPLQHRLSDRLDAVPRELDALLSPEQRQQDQHPLLRAVASIKPELPSERAMQDPYSVAGLEPWALGQLDQPVALALTQVIDDVIGNARRLDAVHDQTDDAEAPGGGVPLRLDGEETITRKERRPDLDPASV